MNLNDMKGAVVLLGLIALIGAAIGIALADFKADIAEDITPTSYVNTSITLTLNQSSEVNFCIPEVDMVVTEVYNGSVDQIGLLTSGNYTVSGNEINISPNMISNRGVTFPINISLSCGNPNYQYNVSGAGEVSISNSTGYLDTIGTIIGVAVLIGIVVLAFAFANR